MAQQMRPNTGPIADCNVHMWDQDDNPVFWLSDLGLTMPSGAGQRFLPSQGGLYRDEPGRSPSGPPCPARQP